MFQPGNTLHQTARPGDDPAAERMPPGRGAAAGVHGGDAAATPLPHPAPSDDGAVRYARAMATADEDSYPGASIGLPPTGRGSLASWWSRIAALVLDWGACMVVAVFLFGVGVLREGGWRAWMILAVYFVESAVLTALAGASFGQLIARIAVVRLDEQPLGWWRALARAAMICLVLPTVVIGAERRGLNDLVLGTVVVNRR